ncbi:PadR family transcriptional regulator [Paeniglutamicibacter sp. R2-26]|uniref:PadR family transcriptional regulator n=1 Tax=Paeniglutamicibacter sp. R2-26 TaxID=3144417 RepID=UPI003EE779A7
MSIRHSLLALLQEGARYGYQLRGEFEERTGTTWPLNIGQVYTTLDRLERDGLVEKEVAGGERQVIYSITANGRDEVSRWFAEPVAHSNPPRNELAIKLALAMTIEGVDVAAVVQAQRTASIRSLQAYTRQRRSAAKDVDARTGNDAAWLLVLDSLIFSTEAEVRWLDHCEGWVSARATGARNAIRTASSTPPNQQTAVSDNEKVSN